MPNIGPLELAVVLLIALIVFGPKKLPELGRGLGRGMRDFKRGISGEDEDDRIAEIAKAPTAAAPAAVVEAAPAPVAEVVQKIDETVGS